MFLIKGGENDEVIDIAISQRRKIYVGSPLAGNLTRTAKDAFGKTVTSQTVFARELERLKAAGYRPLSNYMIPSS